MRGPALLGAATTAFAIAFNLPYALLAARFDYPGVLRQPADEVLLRVAEGGASLVLIWEAFALVAMLFAPLAVALSVTPQRLATAPALSLCAAMAGGLAGLAQAIGLARWVFVVPTLAQTPNDPAAARMFETLNAYGGVAVGEHIGQLLTALFAALLATMQLRENRLHTAALGYAASATIAIGTGEGIAIATGVDGSPFAIGTVIGFLLLTLWLMATGLGLMGWPRSRTPLAVA